MVGGHDQVDPATRKTERTQGPRSVDLQQSIDEGSWDALPECLRDDIDSGSITQKVYKPPYCGREDACESVVPEYSFALTLHFWLCVGRDHGKSWANYLVRTLHLYNSKLIQWKSGATCFLVIRFLNKTEKKKEEKQTARGKQKQSKRRPSLTCIN